MKAKNTTIVNTQIDVSTTIDLGDGKEIVIEGFFVNMKLTTISPVSHHSHLFNALSSQEETRVLNAARMAFLRMDLKV